MFSSWSYLRWTAPALFILMAAAQPALAQLPTPQLTGIFPAGAKAGGSLEVTITGADLDEANQIIFSHTGITSTPKMGEPLMPGKPAKPIANTFVVTLAANVPPGAFEARVKGRFGLSNPRTFIVGTLEEKPEEAGNNSQDKARELTIGSLVNDRADANNRDFYKLTLKAGQRVLIDCRAGRIDSRMDPTIALVNTAGRELTRARDTINRDPVIDFTAPADGVYTLVVYDFLYGGGAEYPYRLAAHQAPLIDFVFPPAATVGTQGAFTIYGRNLPGGQPAGTSLGNSPLEKLAVNIAVPASGAPIVEGALLPQTSFVDSFEYRLPSPGGESNLVSIGIATEPVVLEQEPNDTADKAHKVTIPCELAGQFYPARDRDYVQFDAKKGDVLTIEVLAHRLGLASDPALTIQRVTKNEQGAEVVSDVAQVDDPQERPARIGSDFDTSTDDASYRLVVNDDGTYRVLVRDNFGESRADPRSVYRLIIRKEKPDFRLAAYLDPPIVNNNQNSSALGGAVLRKGGTLELRVNLERRDSFDGEVTISVEGLPAGITCPGAVVGGPTTSASLVFTAAENVTTWSGPIKIVGKANINGQEVTHVARVGTCVWGTQDRNQRPAEFRVARDLMLSVMDKEMQPAHVVVGEDKVYETSRGANLEIPVRVARRDGFAEAIKLTKANLPNEIQVKELNIAGGAADGKLEMQLNQQAIKAGTYTFYLKGDTKLKYARNPDAIKEIEAEQAEFAEMQKMLQEALNKANADKTATAQALQQATTARTQAEQNLNKLKAESEQAANNAKQAADNAGKAKEAADKEAGNQGLVDAASAAQKKAEESAAAAKTAADKVAEGEKLFAEAQEKHKAAEEAKTKAEQLATESQNKVNQANQQKQQLDQRVNQVKQANQPKDLQIQFASTPIKVRIVESPLKLTVGQASLAQKQGDKIELPVTIERLYGFTEAVEVFFEVPGGVGGFNVQKIDIPKDQSQGMLKIALNNDATIGEHAVTIRARARFNNVQCDTTQLLMVKVDKAEPAQ